jgi:hypothetical protein
MGLLLRHPSGWVCKRRFFINGVVCCNIIIFHSHRFVSSRVDLLSWSLFHLLCVSIIKVAVVKEYQYLYRRKFMISLGQLYYVRLLLFAFACWIAKLWLNDIMVLFDLPYLLWTLVDLAPFYFRTTSQLTMSCYWYFRFNDAVWELCICLSSKFLFCPGRVIDHIF